MLWGGTAQPLGGSVRYCVSTPPHPILPWHQHKTKSSYECVAGQREREAAEDESEEGICGSAGEPCVELCPVLTAVPSS